MGNCSSWGSLCWSFTWLSGGSPDGRMKQLDCAENAPCWAHVAANRALLLSARSRLPCRYHTSVYRARRSDLAIFRVGGSRAEVGVVLADADISARTPIRETLHASSRGGLGSPLGCWSTGNRRSQTVCKRTARNQTRLYDTRGAMYLRNNRIRRTRQHWGGWDKTMLNALENRCTLCGVPRVRIPSSPPAHNAMI
jgi:hypothetical protein